MASDRKNKWDGMRETMETEIGDIFQKASDEAGGTVQAGQDRKQGTV